MEKNTKKNNPIGRRIRAFRQNRGLNISELAKKAGMSRSYLSQLELEDVDNPTIETVQKIADALDITVSKLLGEQAGYKQYRTSAFESPFDIEEMEIFAEEDLRNVKILDEETREAIGLISDILTDPQIPMKYIKKIREQIISYATWLKDKMQERARNEG